MQRSLLYDAGLQLSPGQWRVKVLARENQGGKLGTFETRFTVPDLDASEPTPEAVSSPVLASGRERVTAAIGSAEKPKKNPLLADGLTPSVTHMFRRPQTMLVYRETYSPDAQARIALSRGNERIWESQTIQSRSRALAPSLSRRASLCAVSSRVNTYASSLLLIP